MGKIISNNSAELLDGIIYDIQKGLQANIGWLDSIFGRAERVIRLSNDGTNRVYTPCFYAPEKAANDYTDLFPDSNNGNFCFFWVDDPQEVTWLSRITFALKVRVSIIFWFDFRTIYNERSKRDKESVKKEILDTLNLHLNLRQGSVEIVNIYELAENIYKGFSIDEVQNQFLTHPYGGFRLEGVISVRETCKN